MSRASRAWVPGEHISVSATLAWARCPAAVMFDRVLHLPAPDRSFFLLGGELHQIAEWQLTRKRDQQPLPSETEVAARIQQDLQVRCAGEYGVTFGKEETTEMLIEDCLAMAQVWAREVLPQIEPYGLEVKVDQDDGLRLPGSGTPVIAYLDVIDQHAQVRDLKTGKATWPAGAAEQKLATAVYSWAFRVKFGTPPGAFIYDLIVRKKRVKGRPHAEAEYHPIRVIPDPRLEFGALRRLEAIAAQMRQGQYFPNTGPECTDCPYQEFCADHFVGQPFAPWNDRAAPAPADGPRYLTIGEEKGGHGAAPRRIPTARPWPQVGSWDRESGR